MRVGALIEGSTIDAIVDHVASCAAAGYASVWLTDAFGYDPLTVLAIAGRAVDGIEVGTAVVRTHPRHPMELAQQALTVNAATGGRLCLGIGPSHRDSIEQAWGLSFDRPLDHVADYLSVLVPLLTTGTVLHRGATLSADATLHIDDGLPCPVLLGALGPRMIEVAGRLADGAITFMVGPRSLAELTCPGIGRAADAAGRPAPRVVAMLPLCITDDAAAAAARVARGYGGMLSLPSYAAAIEREGAIPILAGTEDEVGERIDALARAGVTDLVALRTTSRDSDDHLRTQAFLTGGLGH